MQVQRSKRCVSWRPGPVSQLLTAVRLDPPAGMASGIMCVWPSHIALSLQADHSLVLSASFQVCRYVNSPLPACGRIVVAD